MAADPMELVETDEGDSSEPERAKSKMNNWVALAVAILATFMGVCGIKDGNICQEMQKQQAASVDGWAWYQAKKIRLQFADATKEQFQVALLAASPETSAAIREKIAKYDAQIANQTAELDEVQAKAKAAEASYDELNSHDDQFDLEEAFLSLAISIFAVTALTQKRWLFAVAMLPAAAGVTMGLAGLCGWGLELSFISKLLGA
jgi:hypothetical protein